MCQRTFEDDGKSYSVNFVIGGDGPKRILLEEAIEVHGLQSRVEMLGELSHSGVYLVFTYSSTV